MPVIAVVEDNPDNRLLARTILEDHAEIQEYESGPEALAGMRQFAPDAVLLDISLPGMDGVAVLAALRADERLRALPVVAITAHAMAGDRERYLELGFDDYVAKPIVDERTLLEALGLAGNLSGGRAEGTERLRGVSQR